jgi:hypothetical protein
MITRIASGRAATILASIIRPPASPPKAANVDPIPWAERSTADRRAIHEGRPAAVREAEEHWTATRNAIADKAHAYGFLEVVDHLPNARSFGEHTLSVRTYTGQEVSLGRVQSLGSAPAAIAEHLEEQLDAIAERLREPPITSLDAFWQRADEALSAHGSHIPGYRELTTFSTTLRQVNKHFTRQPVRMELADLDGTCAPTRTLLVHLASGEVMDLGRLDPAAGYDCLLSMPELFQDIDERLRKMLPDYIAERLDTWARGRKQLLVSAAMQGVRSSVSAATFADLQRYAAQANTSTSLWDRTPIYELFPGDTGRVELGEARKALVRALNGDMEPLRTALCLLAECGEDAVFGRASDLAAFKTSVDNVLAFLLHLDSVSENTLEWAGIMDLAGLCEKHWCACIYEQNRKAGLPD